MLTLTVPSTGLKTATFTVSCSEHGRFVYHISREFAYNTTACSLTVDEISHWIQQSSIDGLRVDETYYECEDILGMENIVTPGATQNIQIDTLQTTTAYTIEGYCLSQIGTRSETKKLNFITQSNGGYVSKMDFFFET